MEAMDVINNYLLLLKALLTTASVETVLLRRHE
jgi:hypothetical protein